ncbi:MAG: hypothetical protein AB7N24_21755 [Dehalococcoidia bacterium]
MKKPLLFAVVLAALLAACGGGGGDSKSDVPGARASVDTAGTAAMAGALIEELNTMKTCYADQVAGKGDCGIVLLQDPVTRICSGVRTGTPDPTYPTADLTKFTPTCDDWASALGLDAAGKVDLLTKMATNLEALK